MDAGGLLKAGSAEGAQANPLSTPSKVALASAASCARAGRLSKVALDRSVQPNQRK